MANRLCWDAQIYRTLEEKAKAQQLSQQTHLPVGSACQDTPNDQYTPDLPDPVDKQGLYRPHLFAQDFAWNVLFQAARWPSQSSRSGCESSACKSKAATALVETANALKKDREVLQLSRMSVVTAAAAPAALESSSWSSVHKLQRLNSGSCSLGKHAIACSRSMLLFIELCSGRRTWIIHGRAVFAAPKSLVPAGPSSLVSSQLSTASTFRCDATLDLMVCASFSASFCRHVNDNAS